MSDEYIDGPILRTHLEHLDIELGEGEVTGYVDRTDSINVNAIAIGLAPWVDYKPDLFPGIIYYVDELKLPDLTVVIFENGVIAVLDAPDEDAGHAGLQFVCEQIHEIGLLEEGGLQSNVVDFSSEIPVPDTI